MLKTKRLLDLPTLYLHDIEELDFEDEGGVAGNARAWRNSKRQIHGRNSTNAVSVIGRDGEDGLLALGHGHDAFIPTTNDLTNTNGEVEGSVAIVGGVELLAVEELERKGRQAAGRVLIPCQCSAWRGYHPSWGRWLRLPLWWFVFQHPRR